MAGVSDKQIHTIGPFVAGLANVPAETDLPVSETGQQIALREAIDSSSMGRA